MIINISKNKIIFQNNNSKSFGVFKTVDELKIILSKVFLKQKEIGISDNIFINLKHFYNIIEWINISKWKYSFKIDLTLDKF
jgi:hypothetical protein